MISLLKSSAVQEGLSGSFTETDGEEIVARRALQHARCYGRDGAFFLYAAQPEDIQKYARERDGVEKQ